jgi:hypothetical protein
LWEPRPAPVGVNVDPLGDRFERSVFPEAFLALLGLAEPAEPDMLPVVFTDEPVVVPHVVAPPIVLCARVRMCLRVRKL